MFFPKNMRATAAIVALGYGAVLNFLLDGPMEVVPLLWLCSPFAVPLAFVLASRKEGRQRLYLAVLLCLTVGGCLSIAWAKTWDKSDFGYLILLLLPFYQFGFVALVVAVTGFTALIRRRVWLEDGH